MIYWKMVDETDLLNSIHKSAKAAGKNITENNVKSQIKTSLQMIGRKNTPKDCKKTWVQFRDVIYDVNTGESFEATPEYFNTNPIPWNVGQSTETPVMDSIFESWVGKDNTELLYDILAYSMIQDYPLHRIFCFVGSGSNGKSCFLRLMERFIGKDNTATSELDGLLERFGTACIYKKLIC